MAKRYLINIFLLIAVLCGFSSCEEDPYYDPYEEITYDLCNYVWTILYMDYEDGQTVLKDIWISGRTFECQYNGEWVTFKAY